MKRIEFRVHGTPKPQGSKRHVGNGVMIESAGEALRSWREDVKQAALRERLQLDEPLSGSIEVHATFWLARPRSHFRSGRNAHLLREAAPSYPWRRPDLDKLLRSTLDAISSADLWLDDCCAVCICTTKAYATTDAPPGALLTLWTLDDKDD